MQEPKHWVRRWFILAFVLAGIHAAFVLFIVNAVRESKDPEAGMAFILFYYADYPVTPLWQETSLAVFTAGVILFGSALWFCYGFVLQSLISIRRTGGVPRLVIGLLAVGLLWCIPEISLRLKPPWEQNWDRAWAIGRGKGTNSQKAIQYVSEAIRLSPPDNEKLGMLWDYLGELYMDEKDYPHAESAFRSHLALVQSQPSPKPVDLLNTYGELDSLYFWSGNIEGRKECLRKCIELNRVVSGGDSVREAQCWQDLAKITHDSGDPKDAVPMLARAIKMYSDLNDQIVPLDYLKRLLRKWETE